VGWTTLGLVRSFDDFLMTVMIALLHLVQLEFCRSGGCVVLGGVQRFFSMALW